MSVAKCETGWGEALSTRTLIGRIDLHPTPAAHFIRVDPPPPGEGKIEALLTPAKFVIKHNYS
jgi:hypothetical protein